MVKKALSRLKNLPTIVKCTRSKAMSGISVENLLQMPFSATNKKCRQTQVLDSKELTE
jgi:hypothetical protein